MALTMDRPTNVTTQIDEKALPSAEIIELSNGLRSSSDVGEDVNKEAQTGVQNIEAVTLTWTTPALIAAYVIIWFIYFFDSMLQGATTALTPFVTSAFQQHSLTPTVGIMASIIGGVFKLTLAKILDVFGRPHGYLMSIILAVIGLIMMAACNTVQMYAAAQVFYTVGNNALLYSLSVFVADTSSLRNRGLMLAFASSPFFITTWISGPLSAAFLEGPGWRWAFGTFTIVLPIVALPLFGLFVHYYLKAKKQGLIVERRGTTQHTFLYFAREFDAVGLFLLSAGLALFLLPFNIYYLQEQGWRSSVVICLLVFGFATIVSFVVWEKYFAPITFIPYSLLLDRTVLGACVLGATLFVGYFCWNSYFGSFLMVVNGLSVTHTSYVSQIYTMGSCLSSVAAGVLIRYTGRFKPVTLYFAIPVTVLGMGLMINFRQPDVNIGYVIMCQIFISFAGGVIITTTAVAAMAAATHQHVAVVLAVLSMFSEIGGAIGLSIAAAIWQGIFPVKLAEYLPVEELPNLLGIYAELPVQLMYPVGTPARIAIQHAYADAQKFMLIAGTAVWAIGLVAVLIWRDMNVKGVKQVTGHVV